MRKLLKICLFTLGLAACAAQAPVTARAEIDISIGIAPPAIPVYTQPECPGDGYLWTPGYWYYGDVGYYWVPGVWVLPPRVGYLWTPGYWGYDNGLYVFNRGYWGPRVGFYGGINYGYGYGGYGYCGGRWDGDVFRYNTAITRVDRRSVRNLYVDRAIVRQNVTASRASFNGRGGVNIRPRPAERMAMKTQHAPPTSAQLANRQSATRNRDARRDLVDRGNRPGADRLGRVADRRSDRLTKREQQALRRRSVEPGRMRSVRQTERQGEFRSRRELSRGGERRMSNVNRSAAMEQRRSMTMRQPRSQERRMMMRQQQAPQRIERRGPGGEERRGKHKDEDRRR